MSKSLEKMIRENISSKFKELGGDELDSIANFIKSGGHFQKIGDYFVFRLFNSVSDREEVFIGNVLFNDYISKLLLRTYNELEKYDGQIALVYNDLENFYYVMKQKKVGRKFIEDLERDFKNYFTENLEELFFDIDNFKEGIYGEFDDRLLKFYVTNRSVFPFYSIPNCFSKQLINLIENEIKLKLKNISVYPTELTANVVDFYAKDGAEKQSTAKFIIERCKEGLIAKEELADALHIEINDLDESKDDVKDAIKDLRDYSFEKQKAYRKLLCKIIEKYKEEPWELYIEGLMTKLKPEKYINEIIDDLFLETLSKNLKPKQTCSICGRLISKNKYNKDDRVNKEVQFGENASKFINRLSTITPKPNARNKGKTVCMNCLLSSFLKCKLLGTTGEAADNQTPEKSNIVFFYGNIPEERLKQISGILNSLYYCTDKPSIYTYEIIDNALGDLDFEIEENTELEADDLLADLIESDQKDKELRKKGKVPPTIWNWYQNGQKADKVKSHIFGVGSGENKLYAFILPYALNRSDEVQKKFSQNRVAVYSMLSFLAKLTGISGNFYYLSTPKLTDDFEEENVFYYKDEKREGQLEEYELLTEVAWDLINERCNRFNRKKEQLFTMRLKLAKELESLPLITLAKVYRVLIKDDNDDPLYKNLSKIRNQDLGVDNLAPLIKVSNKLRKDVKFMGKEIKTDKFEKFVYQFFGELLLIDGVFPQGFGAKPTEFEKYPRLFIKNILKMDLEGETEKKDVLAGFRIWSTKMLHSRSDFYKGKEFINERMFEIKKLLNDQDYREMLADKSNLIYFKRSLFAWLSEFLYPIYLLKKEIELEKSEDRDKLEKVIAEKIENPSPEVERIISLIKTSANDDIILDYAKEYLVNKYNKKPKKDEEDDKDESGF